MSILGIAEQDGELEDGTSIRYGLLRGSQVNALAEEVLCEAERN